MKWNPANQDMSRAWRTCLRGRDARCWSRLLAGAALALLTAAFPGKSPGTAAASFLPIRVTFFALADGYATLLKTSEGKWVLIDAGSASDAPKLLAALRKAGVRSLTALVLTNSNPQYCGGLGSVLRSLPVSGVSAASFERIKSPEIDRLKRQMERELARRHVRVTALSPRDDFYLGYNPQTVFSILNPTPKNFDAFRLRRDSAIAAMVRHERTSVFLAGRLSPGQWADVRREIPANDLKAHVLQVPSTANVLTTYPNLLATVQPKTAIIQVPTVSGQKPPSGTLSALAKARVSVYRTDRHGTVTVILDGVSARVQKGL